MSESAAAAPAASASAPAAPSAPASNNQAASPPAGQSAADAARAHLEATAAVGQLFGESPKGKAADAPADKPATEPAADKAPKAKADKDKSADKPDDPADKPAEAKVHADLAKALVDNRALEAEKLTLKKTADTVTRERDTVKRELEALKVQLKDPFAALEAAGTDIEALVLEIKEGKRKIPEKGQKRPAEPELPPEVKELVEEARRTKFEAQRQNELSIVKNAIETLADDLPNLSGHPSASQRVYDEVYGHHARTGEVLSVEDAARRVEKSLAGEVVALLQSERALKAHAANPLVRAAVLKALGLSEQSAAAPASGGAGKSADVDGPRTLSSVQTSVIPNRTVPLTEQERIRAATEAVDAVFR